MTHTEAIEVARQHALTQGWPWKEPVECKRRGGWFRTAYWEVRSNVGSRGCNAVMIVDDLTETVTKANFLPR